MPQEVSVEESLVFQYWFVVLRLFELGFPLDRIETFTEKEVTMILGVQMALDQRHSELQAQANH